ncbi:MAG TPA: enterochelin esterase domain-containing protein, partial [Ktedonobacteraceae bacterium]
DVWYKTFRVRNDLRNVYQLSPNDSLVPLDEATDWKERTKTFLTDPLNPRIYTFQDDPEDPELADFCIQIGLPS